MAVITSSVDDEHHVFMLSVHFTCAKLGIGVAAWHVLSGTRYMQQTSCKGLLNMQMKIQHLYTCHVLACSSILQHLMHFTEACRAGRAVQHSSASIASLPSLEAACIAAWVDVIKGIQMWGLAEFSPPLQASCQLPCLTEMLASKLCSAACILRHDTQQCESNKLFDLVQACEA